MSIEAKKVPEKTRIPVKAEKAIRPRMHVSPTKVLATFDDMLEDFRRNLRESIWAPSEWPLEPYITVLPAREAFADLVDAGSKFIVHAEVPGIPKDKIEVNVTKDDIEISAETAAEKEEKEKGFVIRERGYSHIYKKLSFPEEVIPEKTEA